MNTPDLPSKKNSTPADVHNRRVLEKIFTACESKPLDEMLEEICLNISDILKIENVYAERQALRKIAGMRTTFLEEVSYIFSIAGVPHSGRLTREQFVTTIMQRESID